MKIVDNFTGKLYNKFFNVRCDVRPGIKYFDISHFDGLLKDDFSFTFDDQTTLRGGYYHTKDYDKNTLVIFTHGIGGGHEAYMKEIAYLCKNGFLVLGVDYRGTILSDGSSLIGFSQPIIDLSKIVDSLKDQYQNIYVIGHSWGGYVAQGLCYFNPKISKICTIAGLNSVNTFFDQLFKFPVCFLKKSAKKIEFNKFKEFGTTSAANTLNNNNLKGLVIQSEDDKILNPKYNYYLVKNNNKNKNIEFLLVNNKNHNPTYTTEAVKKLDSYLNKLNKTKDLNKIKELENNCNFDEISDLDCSIMDKIVSFLKED